MKREILGLTLTGAILVGCSAQAQESLDSKITPELEPATPPESNSLIRLTQSEISSRRIEAQKGMTPVSISKVFEFANVIKSKGSVEQAGDPFKRLIVKSDEGVVYTSEIDYLQPVGTADNQITGLTVYIRKPGEKNAQHVVTDGTVSVDYNLKQPVDGKIDIAKGYQPYSGEKFKIDQKSYDSASAGFLNDIRTLEAVGVEAQADFVKAVEVTLAEY